MFFAELGTDKIIFQESHNTNHVDDNEYEFIEDGYPNDKKDRFAKLTQDDQQALEDDNSYVKMDSFKIYFQDREEPSNMPENEIKCIKREASEDEYLKPMSLRLPVQKWKPSLLQ